MAYEQLSKRIAYHLSISSVPLFLHPPPVSTADLPFPQHSVRVDLILTPTDRSLFGALSQSTPCDAATLLTRLEATTCTSSNVIIIERAERLVRFSPSTASMLFALAQLAGRPDLRLVFISRHPWAVLRRQLVIGVKQPVVYIVPALSQREIVEHIVETSGMKRDARVYAPFVKLVVQALAPCTQDLEACKTVCLQLFPQYKEEYTQCKGANAVAAAFNKVQTGLSAALKGLYNAKLGERDMLQNVGKEMLTLVVASFLAGNNPPSQDVRYFTTQRTRKRGRSERSGEYVFGLERLLAVYEAIKDGEKGVGTEMLVLVGSLVEMGVLQREGGGLEEPKLKCLIGKDKVEHAARRAGIDIEFYLHG